MASAAASAVAVASVGDATTSHAAAWALKQRCYDAWHRDPTACRQAADELLALAAAQQTDLRIWALSAWALGIAALTEGRLADALARLQQAQSRFEQEGDRQHAAETRVPQIAVLAMLGRQDDALSCGEAARRCFEAHGDLRSAAKVDINLGTLLSRQERHAEAEPSFRRAAVRAARAGDTELSILADGALAHALAWQFRFAEAGLMFERARQRAAARGLAGLVSQMHQGLGHIALLRGHWPVALQELVTAVHLAQQAGAAPQRMLEAEMALADAYLAVNLLAEAATLYGRLADTAAALPAPTELAWATLQQARALGRLGDTEAALDGFGRAAALYRAAGHATLLGLVMLGRGHAELAEGDATSAMASADAAIAALADSGIVGWCLEAELLRAAALAGCGQVVLAQSAFEHVLGLSEGPAPLPHLAWQAHLGLGRLAQAAGSREVARQAFERALAHIELAREALPGDELRSAQGCDAEAPHQGLLALALADGQAEPVLLAMERGRGRALALALADRHGQAAQPGTEPPEQAMRLAWLRQQWQQAVAMGDTDRSPALAARVQALEQDLLETQRRGGLFVAAGLDTDLAKPKPHQRKPPVHGAAAGAPTQDVTNTGGGAVVVPDTAVAIASAPATPPNFGTAALGQLRQALGADRALVAFQMLEEGLPGERLLACVATTDGVLSHDWPVKALAERLRSLRFQMDALRFGNALMARHGPLLLARTRALLQRLHADIWAPLVPLLGGRQQLTVLPHRALHYLPFAALHDGQHWLAQQYSVTLAPSAAAWLALQCRPAQQTAPSRALVLGVGGPGLPHVAREAQAVAAEFGPAARLLLGAEATLAAWADQAGQADVLHLACHGQFRADNPAFSYLQLGDGRLALHALGRQRLRAALVVLSACETGAGHVAAGEEVQGLVRAFLLAGARNVLATLWPVDDEATASLVGTFYRELASGAAPSLALQQAQARAAGAGAHPFHWAGFVLHGGG